MINAFADMSPDAAYMLVAGSTCVLVGVVLLLFLVAAASSRPQERRTRPNPNPHRDATLTPTCYYTPADWDAVFRREELRRDGYSTGVPVQDGRPQ